MNVKKIIIWGAIIVLAIIAFRAIRGKAAA